MEEHTVHDVGSDATGSHWPGGRYVVGIDGSPQSNDALRHALRLASVTGAQVEAVTVWEYPVVFGPEWTPTDWSPEANARQVLNQAVATVVGASVPPRLSLVLREGNAVQALVDQSTDADLLIVGSRGHGGFAGLLLGSVSSACAEHSHCPVLVIHGTRSVLPDPAERAALDL
jgi:nucleotide-binding universal stress UspA family protein